MGRDARSRGMKVLAKIKVTAEGMLIFQSLDLDNIGLLDFLL